MDKLTLPEHIKFFPIKTHSEEWHNHRKNYVGGSDIGTVLGINKWQSRAKLWQIKSGQREDDFKGSEPTFWGSTMEPIIGDKWCYYDIETGEYLENAERDHKARRNIDPQGFIVNDKYPWLSIALDRVIPEGEYTFFGEVLQFPAPLEIKTIDHYAHQSNSSGLPPYYEAQIMAQMMCLESDYAEFAYLVGGIKFIVEPRRFNQGFADSIADVTYDFWYNYVVPAKEIQQDIVNNPKMAKMLYKRFAEFEPPVESSEVYNEWLRDEYKGETPKMQGEPELWQHFIKHKNAELLAKELGRISLEAKNHIMKCHKDNSVQEITYNEGKSTFGKQHRVTVKPEHLLSESEVKHKILGLF